jgi:hypothetical protein
MQSQKNAFIAYLKNNHIPFERPFSQLYIFKCRLLFSDNEEIVTIQHSYCLKFSFKVHYCYPDTLLKKLFSFLPVIASYLKKHNQNFYNELLQQKQFPNPLLHEPMNKPLRQRRNQPMLPHNPAYSISSTN